MATLEKGPAPVLPTVDPSIPNAATSSKRRNTVKRGLLAGAGVLTLLVLSRPTHLAGFELPIPSFFRTPVVATQSYPDSRVPQLGVPEKIQRHWGQYSPYFPVGEYVQPPPGCVIDQVNIVRICAQLVSCPYTFIVYSSSAMVHDIPTTMTITTRL